MSTEPTQLTVSPVTVKGILTAEALKSEGEQRVLLAKYIKNEMVTGTDFGVIPGTAKPTLLKPGAEKLTDLFRCTPKFHLVKIQEDFDKGFFNYVFRVRLHQRDADVVLAEGYGSANSREGRYRWRDAQRKCPNCGKPTIIKGKVEYGGGWVCFAKKGGCNTKWKDGAPEIEKQEVGRIENDDIATLANTILKMAKKRALVDGAIALARCSDMFTQDVEDMDESRIVDDAPPPPVETPHPRATKTQPSEKPAKGFEKVDLSPPVAQPCPPAPRPGGPPSVYERVRVMAAEFGLTGLRDQKQLQASIKACTGKTSSLQLAEEDLLKMKVEFEKAAAAAKSVDSSLNKASREPGEDDAPF